ncbi:MAG: hypothetical protein ACLFVO_28940 [Chloroflexaceae bacterium]
MRNVPPTIDEVLALARQLTPCDQARLIAHLADNPADSAGTADLSVVIPVVTEGQWDAAIPTRRAELYGDDERGGIRHGKNKKTHEQGYY